MEEGVGDIGLYLVAYCFDLQQRAKRSEHRVRTTTDKKTKMASPPSSSLQQQTDHENGSDPKITSSLVLSRHYGTIGMADVFLVPPPHPLPSTYLLNHDSSPPQPFTSNEVIATLKSTPQDFVVREIMDSSKTIEGISQEDRSKLRVAEIFDKNNGRDEIPRQNLPAVVKQEAPKRQATSSSQPQNRKEDEDWNVCSPLESLRSLLGAINKQTADTMMESLQSLHDQTLQQIKEYASSKIDDNFNSILKETLFIPPFPDAADDGDSSNKTTKKQKGELHRALKLSFPLLYSQRCKNPDNDQEDHCIKVTVDDSFMDLAPLLSHPEHDLPELYRFRNRGFDHHDSKLLLPIPSNISKEDRRTIHQLIASKCKYLSTSFVKEEGGSAIAVEWSSKKTDDRRRRSNHKRKRTSSSSTPDQEPSSSHINPYPHALFVMKKTQMEHLFALSKLQAALRCRHVSVAGIKDMHAVTYQYCTAKDYDVRRLHSARGRLPKGLEISNNTFQVDWLLNNGDLHGNRFELVLRNLEQIEVSSEGTETRVQCSKAHLQQQIERLRKHGFINFYGEQRLGTPGTAEEVGVRSFDIGKAMLQQDFGRAIDLILTGRRTQNDNPISEKVYATWIESKGNVAQTLKALPKQGDSMPRERALLRGLNRYGKDQPLLALQCLPYNARMFYINAYQSFAWNRVASERIRRLGTSVVKGDLYLNDGGDGDTSSEVVQVVSDDETLHKVKLSQVVLPLPGYNIMYPENEIGNFYKECLLQDKVQFQKDAPPEATAKGSYRHLIQHVTGLSIEHSNGDEAAGETMTTSTAKLEFELKKGAYATVMLRELFYQTVDRR